MSGSNPDIPVRIRTRSKVLEILLDRPAEGNMLTAAMAEAMLVALQTVGDEVLLIVIRAAGADFCVGRVSPMPERSSGPSAEGLRRLVTAPPIALYGAIKACPVPTIAVVRGRASGVGCALAAACDLTICDADASFTVPELERDVPPTLVMAALLGRVPLKTIAHLVLTRLTLSASQALAAGLVTQVCAKEELDGAVDEVCARVLSCSSVTLRAVKTFLQLGPEMTASTAGTMAAYIGATSLSEKFTQT